MPSYDSSTVLCRSIYNRTNVTKHQNNKNHLLTHVLHSKKSFSYFKKKILVSRIIFLKQEFFTRENSEKYFLTEKIFLKIFLKIRKNIFLF